MHEVLKIAKSLLIPFFITLIFWGAILLPQYTFYYEAGYPTVHPSYRVTGESAERSTEFEGMGPLDASGAWVELPIELFYHQVKAQFGSFPKWNPYIGSGYPISYDGHVSLYSPTQFLLQLLPGPDGRDILIFLRVYFFALAVFIALGFLGVAPFLRALLTWAATLAPSHAIRIDHASLDAELFIVWYLVLILWVERNTIAKHWLLLISVLFGSFIGSLSFVQAQFTDCLIVFLLSLVWFRKTRGFSVVLCFGFAFGFSLLFPNWYNQIWASQEMLSSRAAAHCIAGGDGVHWKNFLFQLFTTQEAVPKSLATMGGLLLLLLTPRVKPTLLFSYVIFAAFMVVGAPFFCSFDGINGVRTTRHLASFTQFLFLINVGVALQNRAKSFDKLLWLALWGICGLCLIRTAFPYYWIYWGIGGILLFISFKNKKENLALFSFFIITVLPLVYPLPRYYNLLQWKYPKQNTLPPLALKKDSPLGQVQLLSKEEDRRHFSADGILFPNWSAAYEVFDVRLLSALFPKSFYQLNSSQGLTSLWYADAIHAIKPDRFLWAEPREAAFSEEFQRLLVVNRVSLLSFANSAFPFAQRAEIYSKETCKQLGTSETATSYYCPRVGSIGYFPANVQWVNNPNEATREMKSLPLGVLEQTAFLSQRPSGGVLKESLLGKNSGEISNIERKSDVVEYSVETKKESVFVFADTDFQGWKVYINGVEQPLYRANVAFKAVVVPVGKSKVRFEYIPSHVW